MRHCRCLVRKESVDNGGIRSRALVKTYIVYSLLIVNILLIRFGYDATCKFRVGVSTPFLREQMCVGGRQWYGWIGRWLVSIGFQ